MVVGVVQRGSPVWTPYRDGQAAPFYSRHLLSGAALVDATSIMRFLARGKDITTGVEVELTVDAPDVAGARRRCHEMGVRVESITEAGRPTSAEPVLVRMEPGYVQTIEQTGKSWKALLLVSLLLLTLGLASCSWAVMRDPKALTHPPLLSISGATLAIVGLAGVIAARIGAWWKHG